MSLGSPMLVTFSLMMTILNQRWLHQKCKILNHRHGDGPLASRLRSARVFIEAAQQVPIRMSVQNGWLPSLILLENNANWWTRLGIHILATRRDVTLSLVAQILVAIIAWVLTIVGSFGASLSPNGDTFLVLSSSSVWTWLVSQELLSQVRCDHQQLSTAMAIGSSKLLRSLRLSLLLTAI